MTSERKRRACEMTAFQTDTTNVNGINNATAIVGDNPGVAPRISPPIVPNSKRPKFIGANTSSI